MVVQLLCDILPKGEKWKDDGYDKNVCVVVYTKYNMTMLLLNNNNCQDDDFVVMLNDVSALFYRYNPSHVVFGGDMNVDLS